ncbi:hypothetical protein ABH963_003772 [Bacillus sp. RC55]|uniref:hypothetical protein n=1 Tax=Bacillus sp. RC55 TaxID=3156292 RepID=UPI002DBE3897|nr:hypothetical protein [Bacillus cereus]
MSNIEKSIKQKLTLLLRQHSETLNFVEELSQSGDLLFFGGSIRDLYITKDDSLQFPRDFDIAINFRNKKVLENLKEKYPYKINRFGGYKFYTSVVEFDIWDLNNTWAFKNTNLKASEENLARSVYLNIDGIVFNYNKECLYDEIFKETIQNSLLDITLEKNPQIELNLLRALVFKSKYNLVFSNRLKEVFREFKSNDEKKIIDNLYKIQLSHYRTLKFSKEEIRNELQYI